ncbi:hypothetical protein ACFL2K_01040 [Candidatus Margulisiibacteriota bacterium]
MSNETRLITIERDLKHLSKDFYVNVERQTKKDEKFEKFLDEFKTMNSELIADLKIVSSKIKATQKIEDGFEPRLQNVEKDTQANGLQLKWSIGIAIFLLTPLYSGLIGLAFMLVRLK